MVYNRINARQYASPAPVIDWDSFPPSPFPPPDPDMLELHYWIFSVANAEGRAGELWRRILDEPDEDEGLQLDEGIGAAVLISKLKVLAIRDSAVAYAPD